MMKRLLAVLMLAMASAAFGQDVFQSMSADQMRSLLRGAKLDFKETKGDDALVFDFALDGDDVSLYFFEKSLMIQTSFRDTVSAARINEWNRSERFNRAYVNDKGNPFLESDLSFSGGVTKNTVLGFLDEFSASMDRFIDFLTEGDDGPPLSAEKHSRPESALARVRAPFGDFAVWMDGKAWDRKKDDTNRIEFAHVTGVAFGAIIAEELELPMEALGNIAVTNAKAMDPNAAIVKEERRTVNGHEVLMVQMNATIEKIPFRFYGYYYSNKSGTMQLVTWTTVGAFEKNYQLLTDFLDGLEIKD